MYPIINQIVALNGESWSAPASTLDACWAALGAGANALALNVFMTKDDEVVCVPTEKLSMVVSKSCFVHELTLTELQQIDAGIEFQSIKVDNEYQPTGAKGKDHPWRGLTRDDKDPLKSRKSVFFPSLVQVMEYFSRRTDFCINLPENDHPLIEPLVEKTIKIVQRFGLQKTLVLTGTAPVLKRIRDHSTENQIALQIKADPSKAELENLSSIGGKQVIANYDVIAKLSDVERNSLFKFANEHGIRWIFSSHDMPYAPNTEAQKAMESYDCSIAAWMSQSALATKSACLKPSLIFEEGFQGDMLNTQYWSAGYSHVNLETEISVNDSLIIDIRKGEQYSGGAAICLLPVHGDFDVEVSFHVANPHQATTFELAAIGIDPGYRHIENDNLNTRTVNLTFDVHGAPPYASSERDQNDGFRCGWNNSFNFAKFGDSRSPRPDKEWLAASSNMYNKYGRDVGDGSAENLTGKLRLIRTGSLFNTYYCDAHNSEWVCSGTMLVQSLPKDAFLRLAAKHWHKIHPAPPNTVKFWDFKIHQS